MALKLSPTAGNLFAALAVLAVGATLVASAGARPDSRAAAKPITIAVLLNSSANTYYQANLAGAEAAAKKYGGQVTKVFSANFDAATQAAQIQDAITAKAYNVFLIAPTASNVIVPQVTQAVKAGIKVACMLSPCGANPNGMARQIAGLTTFVGYSMTENGSDIAEAVVEACAKLDPCNVVYEPGDNTLPAEVVRTGAFNAYLKSHPNVKVLAEQQGQYLAGPGRTAMQNMLEAHPDINVAASSGDQMTAGMAQAVKAAGDSGKIKLIGNGASVPGVAAVKAGQWFATVANVPFTEGYIAAEYAIEAAKGTALAKIPGFVDDLKDTGVGTAIITQANAGKFKAQWAG
jgi:ribose transport system substrate-binding protein